MVILATSENNEKTKKLEISSMWGAISITYSKIKNGKYVIEWSKPYQSIERAGLWFRKYEVSLLKLSPEEQHKKIDISISAEGEITLK